MLWLLLLGIVAGANMCDSCASCTGATGDIYLTQDIVADSDVCITLTSNEKLDCNGYRIISNNSSIGILAWGNNIEISNCVLEGFQYGVYVNNSLNTTLTNNDLEGNQYGVFSDSSNIYAYNNRVCFNNISDLYAPAGWGSSNGSENQCDSSGNWTDVGFPGECTYYCSGNDTSPPQVFLLGPNGTISFQPVTYMFKAQDDQASVMKCALLVEGYNLGDITILNNTPVSFAPVYYFGSFSPQWNVVCKDRNQNRGQATPATLSVLPSVCECYDKISCQQALLSSTCNIVEPNNSIVLDRSLFIPSNKILDCRNYSISGSTNGLNITNISNFTLRNCNISTPGLNIDNGGTWHNISLLNVFTSTYWNPPKILKGMLIENITGYLTAYFYYPEDISHVRAENANVSVSTYSQNNITNLFWNSSFDNTTVRFIFRRDIRTYVTSPVNISSNTSISINHSKIYNTLIEMEVLWDFRVDTDDNIAINITNSEILSYFVYKFPPAYFSYYRYMRDGKGDRNLFMENVSLPANISLGWVNKTILNNATILGVFNYTNDSYAKDPWVFPIGAQVVINNSKVFGALDVATYLILENTSIENASFYYRKAYLKGNRFFNNTHGPIVYNLTKFEDNIMCDNSLYDVYAPDYRSLLTLLPVNNTCDNFFYNGSFFFDIGHFGCANPCSGNITQAITLLPLGNQTLPVNVTFNISGASPTYLCGVVINGYAEAWGIGTNGTFNTIYAFDPANVLRDVNNTLQVQCYNGTKYISNNITFNISRGPCFCDGVNCADALQSRYCSEVLLINNISNISFDNLVINNNEFNCQGYYLENISFSFDSLENFTIKDCNFENSSNVFVLPDRYQNVTFLNLSFKNIGKAIYTGSQEVYNITFKDILAQNVSYLYIKDYNYTSLTRISWENVLVNGSYMVFVDGTSTSTTYRSYNNYTNITILSSEIGFNATGSMFRFYNITILDSGVGFNGSLYDVNLQGITIKNTSYGFNTFSLKGSLYSLNITNTTHAILANHTAVYIRNSIVENNSYGIRIAPFSTTSAVFINSQNTRYCNEQLDFMFDLGVRPLDFQGWNNTCSRFELVNDIHNFGCTQGCAVPIPGIVLNITSPENGSVVDVVPVEVNFSIQGPPGNYRCGIVVNSSYWDWEVAWEGNITPGGYSINLTSAKFNLQNQIRLECFYNDAKYRSNNVTFNISNATCYCFDAGSCTSTINSPICEKVILANNATHHSRYAFINLTTNMRKIFDCDNNWVVSFNNSYYFIYGSYRSASAVNVTNCNVVGFRNLLFANEWTRNESNLINLTATHSTLQPYITNLYNTLFYNTDARINAFLNIKNNISTYQLHNITFRNISNPHTLFSISGVLTIPTYSISIGHTYLHGMNISNIFIENSSINRFLSYLYGVAYYPRYNMSVLVLPLELRNVRSFNSTIQLFYYSKNNSYTSTTWNVGYIPFLVENVSLIAENAFYVDEFPIELALKDIWIKGSNSTFANITINISNTVLLGGPNTTTFVNVQGNLNNVTFCDGEYFDFVRINTSLNITDITTTWSNPYIRPDSYCKPLSSTSLQLVYPKNNTYLYLYPPYDFIISLNGSNSLEKCGLYLNNLSIYLTNNISFPANISPDNYPTGNLQGLLLCEDANNTYELFFNFTFNKECFCDSYETCNQAYVSPDCDIIYINASLELNQTMFNYTNMSPKTISCMGHTISNSTFFTYLGGSRPTEFTLTIKDCVFENMDAVVNISSPRYIYSNQTIILSNITVRDSLYGMYYNNNVVWRYVTPFNITLDRVNCTNVSYCFKMAPSVIPRTYFLNLTVNNSIMEGGFAGVWVNYSDVQIENTTILHQTYSALISQDSDITILYSNLSSNGRGTYILNGTSFFNESIFCFNSVQDVYINDVDSLNHLGTENQCDSPGGTNHYDDLNAYGCTYLCPASTNNPPVNNILSPLNNTTYYGPQLLITFNITDNDNLFPNNTLRVYMDLSGNSPIYFNDSYVSGTLATFVYTNPLALPGLYYLTIYSRDRYKFEDRDVIAFYWYPDACYCGSCEECSAALVNTSCSRIVINQSFNATQPVCLDNATKPIIGQGYTIFGNGGVGINAYDGAIISDLVLVDFGIAINGSGNITLVDLRIENNSEGILAQFLNISDSYVCFNELDINITSSYISSNTTCQDTINFDCDSLCVVKKKKRNKPPVEEENVTTELLGNNTTVVEEDEIPVEELSQPAQEPTTSPSPELEEVPTTPPEEEVNLPSSPSQTPSPPKQDTPKEEIRSQTSSTKAQILITPYVFGLGLIVLLLLLLARVAFYTILETNQGYVIKVWNILNQPLKNKEIWVDGRRFRLSSDGTLSLELKPSKLSMRYRILLKK